jgi:cell division septal protein FtsQ
MPPNQAPPARNVKIRRVRGLLTIGVAAVVLVLVLFLAVSQPAAGADAGGAYQYAGFT